MMLLAFLLQSALPTGTPPSIAPGNAHPAEETPESATQALGIFRCRLTGDDGRSSTFVLRDGGGRGYRDPRTGEIGITDADVTVESSPSALFNRYDFKSVMHGGEPGYRGWARNAGAALGPQVDLRLSRVTPPLQRANERWAVAVDGHWQWIALTRAVGFCDLERIPQQPLNEAETRKYLKL